MDVTPSRHMFFFLNLRNHSATTNEEGMGVLRGRWLNPLADIMTGVAIIMRD